MVFHHYSFCFFLPYDTATSLLVIYLKNLKTYRSFFYSKTEVNDRYFTKLFQGLSQLISSGENFCSPWVFLQCLKIILSVTSGNKRLLLSANEWSLRILLNILQCTWQFSTIKNDLAPNVNSAEIEKSLFKWINS